MNGPEHYREAERLITLVNDGLAGDTELASTQLLAMAQAHAALALTAVAAQQLADRYVGDGDHINEWTSVVRPTLDVLCGTSETDTECVQPKGHDGDHLDIEGRYFR